MQTVRVAQPGAVPGSIYRLPARPSVRRRLKNAVHFRLSHCGAVYKFNAHSRLVVPVSQANAPHIDPQ